MTNENNRSAMASMLITLKAIAKIQGNENLAKLVRVSGPYFLKAERKQHQHTWNQALEYEFAQGICDNEFTKQESWENFEDYFKETFKNC